MASFLFLLGAYILIRFAFDTASRIVTEKLLSSGRMEPRKVVGTVDASEFLVALSACVGALLAGGLAAAWIVRHLNARVLAAAAGGFILHTNAHTFLGAVGFDSNGVRVAAYATILTVWVVALYHAIFRAQKREESHPRSI